MNPLEGKRLVIFGCGYLGTAVAQWGLSAQLQVTALTRNPAKAELLASQGVSTVVSDLATGDWHPKIAARPDFVLNCVSSGGGGMDAYRRSYEEGMRSILRWGRERGPMGTLVYTGSTAVYPQDGGVVVTEEAAVGGGTERGTILRNVETSLRDATDARQRWFVLRLAGLYGPGRYHLLEQVRSGTVSGRGDSHLNLIHRDDALAGIVACFLAPATLANEVFNLADDGPAPKQEIVRWLADKLGCPVPTFTGEAAPGRRVMTPDRKISNRKAREILGWRPRYSTFREGYASLLSP